MKIGKLIFRDYAAGKPVLITEYGLYLTVKEAFAKALFHRESLHALPAANQKKLTLERYRHEPDFQLGIFGVGFLPKSEVIRNISEETPFGKLAVRVEMQYCNELMQLLGAEKRPAKPRMKALPLPAAPEWKLSGRSLSVRLTSVALFAENTTDAVTSPFAAYRKAQVHPLFAARGFRVVVREGAGNNRAAFAAAAVNPLTVYAGGVGHGGYDTYTGHAAEPLLEKGAYEAAEVEGKAIHFLSCRTAGQLGPDTVEKGAACYMGYDENFTFVWDEPSTPVVEEELFQNCDSTFDLFMANGHTAGEAWDATLAAFNAAIARVPGTAAAAWLTYDRDHCRLLGNRDARILPFRYARLSLPLKKETQELLAEIGES